MKAQPLYDRVLILPFNGSKEIEGVLLPDTDKETHKVGAVVQVGEGYVDEFGNVRPLRLKQGDTVIFGPFAGLPIRIDDTEFLVLREQEVVLKIIS